MPVMAFFLCMTLLSLPLLAADSPATMPHEPPAVFGQSVQGLAIAIISDKHDPLSVTIIIRNDGPADLSVKDGFVWLLFAQSREKAFFSQRISLDAQPRLSSGAAATLKIDLAAAKLGIYEKGVKVVAGYPQRDVGQTTIDKELPGASVRLQAIACLPAGGENLVLRSPATTLLVLSRKTASTMSIPSDAAALLERFGKDPFAAKAAHDQAVKQGTDILPMLIESMKDATMPDFGRMWLATTIVDIGGEQAEQCLALLVADKSEGVRDVVAYHGSRMKSRVVDEAIIARAKEGKDTLFTAWAARGFHENKRDFPESLVMAAVSSSEPRARAEIADLLAARGRPEDTRHMAELAADPIELVRVAVADAVAKHNVKANMVLAALVRALRQTGEDARSRVVRALSLAAGKDWVYDRDASPEANAHTIREIEMWWKSASP